MHQDRAAARLRWLTKRPVAGTFVLAVVVFLLVLVEVALFVQASGSSALSLLFLAVASVGWAIGMMWWMRKTQR